MHLFIKDIFLVPLILEQHFLVNKNLDIIFNVKSTAAVAAANYISWFSELFGILVQATSTISKMEGGEFAFTIFEGINVASLVFSFFKTLKANFEIWK